MRGLYGILFHVLRVVGRPIHGIRPRRIYHWLARRAWTGTAVTEEQFRWYRDRWGFRFRLHPWYHIDRNIIAFGAHEPEMLEFLRPRLRRGQVCFDVGANLGQVTVHMAAAVGSSGRVYAFEPVPRIMARLECHVRANGLEDVVEYCEGAMSDREGTAVFSMPAAGFGNQGVGSLLGQSIPTPAQDLRVRTITLDGFVESRGIERIDLMKIDIQGAEPLLLEGGRETLGRLSPDLIIEVSPDDLRIAGSDSRQLLLTIEAFGYEIYEIVGQEATRRLHAREVSPGYSADNVFCTRPRRNGPVQ